MFRSRLVAVLCAALYFATLASLAFVIAPGASDRSWLWIVLLFIPVGFFLVGIFGRERWWVALAFSVVAAAWLEAAQTVWMPAGYADGIDILLATLGAAVGVVTAVAVCSWQANSRHARPSPTQERDTNIAGNRRASDHNS
ncbi:MAG: VanZ family protein [Rhodoglobus sp.]